MFLWVAVLEAHLPLVPAVVAVVGQVVHDHANELRVLVPVEVEDPVVARLPSLTEEVIELVQGRLGGKLVSDLAEGGVGVLLETTPTLARLAHRVHGDEHASIQLPQAVEGPHAALEHGGLLAAVFERHDDVVHCRDEDDELVGAAAVLDELRRVVQPIRGSYLEVEDEQASVRRKPQLVPNRLLDLAVGVVGGDGADELLPHIDDLDRLLTHTRPTHHPQRV